MNDVIEVSESYHPIPLPLSFEDVDGLVHFPLIT